VIAAIDQRVSVPVSARALSLTVSVQSPASGVPASVGRVDGDLEVVLVAAGAVVDHEALAGVGQHDLQVAAEGVVDGHGHGDATDGAGVGHGDRAGDAGRGVVGDGLARGRGVGVLAGLGLARRRRGAVAVVAVDRAVAIVVAAVVADLGAAKVGTSET
jgi:hypothetical protein